MHATTFHDPAISRSDSLPPAPPQSKQLAQRCSDKQPTELIASQPPLPRRDPDSPDFSLKIPYPVARLTTHPPRQSNTVSAAASAAETLKLLGLARARPNLRTTRSLSQIRRWPPANPPPPGQVHSRDRRASWRGMRPWPDRAQKAPIRQA